MPPSAFSGIKQRLSEMEKQGRGKNVRKGTSAKRPDPRSRQTLTKAKAKKEQHPGQSRHREPREGGGRPTSGRRNAQKKATSTPLGTISTPIHATPYLRPQGWLPPRFDRGLPVHNQSPLRGQHAWVAETIDLPALSSAWHSPIHVLGRGNSPHSVRSLGCRDAEYYPMVLISNPYALE